MTATSILHKHALAIDDDPPPSLRKDIIAGVMAITIGFGGFAIWGYTARLDSAAVGSGAVIVDTKRKPVSHLEGGILKTLLVNEGDTVAEGQALALLDDTKARSELGQLRSRRVGLLAKLARLRAEQEGLPEVIFPEELLASPDQFQMDVVRNERLLFERRRDTVEGTIEVQRKQIEEHSAAADAAAAQETANLRQRQLIQSQIDSIQILADKGYATKAQLIDLQGKLSVIMGDGGEYSANRAQAEKAKAGAELEIAKFQRQWQSDIADAMQTTSLELNAVSDQIVAASDILRRITITSPQDGIVTNIQVRTQGGVIPAGQTIMEIVPENEPRIIEARIDPRDIDSARVGANVMVRLTAYGARQIAPLAGKLTYIAADQQVDERSQTPFYVVRAEISDEALKDAPQVTLYPGMPAEVLILNRPRLAIDYLLSPLTDSLSRAFHEE